FKMQIAWHKKSVSFKQKIKLKKPVVEVSGTLEFMTCDDKNCLPPEEVPFSVHVDASKSFNKEVSAGVSEGKSDAGDSGISSSTDIPDDIVFTELDPSAEVSGARDSVMESDTSLSVPVLSGVSSDASGSEAGSPSLWGIFIAGILGGFAA